MSVIRVEGAALNNLKRLTLEFPAHSITVVTGPSGSGKSSLVFGIILEEARRLASLATASKFPPQRSLSRASGFRSISGLSVPHAFSAQLRPAHRWQTVATVSGLQTLLAEIYYRASTPACELCGMALSSAKSQQVAREIAEAGLEGNVEVLSPVELSAPEGILPALEKAHKQGFVRAKIDGDSQRIEDLLEFGSDALHASEVEIVVDSIPLLARAFKTRLRAAAELAYALSAGKLIIAHEKLGRRNYTEFAFCQSCQREQADVQREQYLPFRLAGRCPVCLGSGVEELPEAAWPGTCSHCQGTRFNRAVGSRLIEGKSYTWVLSTSLAELNSFIQALPARSDTHLQQLIEAGRRILSCLLEFRLSYLSLSRSLSSLSSGERQRVELARELALPLNGLSYLFDEPSVGLHELDLLPVIKRFRDLADKGRALIVVDHDPRVIAAADKVLALGPGSGPQGGEIQEFSPPQPEPSFSLRPAQPSEQAQMLSVQGLSLHNLKNIALRFPLRSFVAVSGVSGSGKTSAIVQTLVPLIREKLKRPDKQSAEEIKRLESVCDVSSLKNIKTIEKLLLTRSYYRSLRQLSTLGSVSGLEKEFRLLYSKTLESRALGLSASSFVPQGKSICLSCQGRGLVQQVGSEYSELCRFCRASRVTAPWTEITYRDLSYKSLFEKTVGELAVLFARVPQLSAILNTLLELGLGHLQLFRRLNTLSTGEEQRLRLAADLTAQGLHKTLIVLDEPTRGLGALETDRLCKKLREIIKEHQASVIVIEHNPHLLRQADYLLEFGPEGGEQGGRIIREGFCPV